MVVVTEEEEWSITFEEFEYVMGKLKNCKAECEKIYKEGLTRGNTTETGIENKCWNEKKNTRIRG